MKTTNKITKLITGSTRLRFRADETADGDCSDVLSSIVSSKLLEIVRRRFIRNDFDKFGVVLLCGE